MTKLQTKLLKWIASRIVIQSSFHMCNIIMYYKILYNAAKKEFTEDNKPTLDDFLIECHKESLKEDDKFCPICNRKIK